MGIKALLLLCFRVTIIKTFITNIYQNINYKVADNW